MENLIEKLKQIDAAKAAKSLKMTETVLYEKIEQGDVDTIVQIANILGEPPSVYLTVKGNSHNINLSNASPNAVQDNTGEVVNLLYKLVETQKMLIEVLKK